jgi:hypothetical protein
MTEPIQITIGFQKSDGSRYSQYGLNPTAIVGCDALGINTDDFDCVVDAMVIEGTIRAIDIDTHER